MNFITHFPVRTLNSQPIHAGRPNATTPRASWSLPQQTRDALQRYFGGQPLYMRGANIAQFRDEPASLGRLAGQISTMGYDNAVKLIGLTPGSFHSKEQVEKALSEKVLDLQIGRYDAYGEPAAGWDIKAAEVQRAARALQQFYPGLPDVTFVEYR